MEKLSCFVIMPFSETEIIINGEKKTISEEEWSYIYENWIKKAVESFGNITCNRSPLKPGNFVKGIVKDIASSDITIADLTGGKPNVYYELGIRHALKNGTIIISQVFSNLPSDLKSYHCFEYKYSEEAYLYKKRFSEFEKQIHKYIGSIIKEDYISDNPVSDFLEDKKGKINSQEVSTSTNQKLEISKIFGEDVILVLDRNGAYKVLKIHNIEFIAAERAYSKIHTNYGEDFILSKPMSSILKEIKSSLIVRVHRSFAININKVSGIKGNTFILSDKTEIPFSKNYVK